MQGLSYIFKDLSLFQYILNLLHQIDIIIHHWSLLL